MEGRRQQFGIQLHLIWLIRNSQLEEGLECSATILIQRAERVEHLDVITTEIMGCLIHRRSIRRNI